MGNTIIFITGLADQTIVGELRPILRAAGLHLRRSRMALPRRVGGGAARKYAGRAQLITADTGWEEVADFVAGWLTEVTTEASHVVSA